MDFGLNVILAQSIVLFNKYLAVAVPLHLSEIVDGCFNIYFRIP